VHAGKVRRQVGNKRRPPQEIEKKKKKKKIPPKHSPQIGRLGEVSEGQKRGRGSVKASVYALALMGKRPRDDDKRKGEKKDKDASDGDSSDGEGDMPTFQGSKLFPNFPSCVLCIHSCLYVY
jgi:hypothetical protein